MRSACILYYILYIACYGPDGSNCSFYFVEKMHFKYWDNLVNQYHNIN